MTEKEANPRKERGGVVGPILLIAAGLFFLLSNMGIISWDFWTVVWRLWPIALIAVGLDLLIGRRSLLASLLVAIVTLGLLVAGFLWLGTQQRVGRGEVTDTISQPLDDAGSAEVTIEFGVGQATLSALPAGSDRLIEGSLRHPREIRVEESFNMSGDTAVYRLRTEGSVRTLPFFGGPGERWVWDLQLSPDVPLRLVANTGVGETVLDLRELTITDLSVDTGVGQTTVMLPGHGQLAASVNGGVGELIVEIPDGVPVRIEVDTGLGNTDIPDNFERDGDVYVSPGYDDTLDRIDLDLNAGIGQVTVRTYGGR